MLRKLTVIIFLLGVIIFASHSILFAGGGSFQEKISKKISSGSRNFQYSVKEETEQDYAPKLDYQNAQITLSEESAADTYNYNRVKGKNLPAAASPRLERAKAQSPMPAPSAVYPIASPYAVYKADYSAEIEEDVATVKGSIVFEVFRKGWTQIPLAKSSVGLIDVRVNKGTSFVTMQSGQYYLMINKAGRYNLDMEFLIKAIRERENGPGSFSFEVIPAPICQFEFTMPEQDVEIFVEPSIKLEVKRETKKTVAWAVMPNTNAIGVRWTKALPKETITPVKIEPKIYADTATYAAIGEGIIRCRSNINYSILQSEVSNFRVILPKDVSILEVKGNNLRDWKVSTENDSQYLDVYLNFGVKGNYALNVSCERKIAEDSTVAQVPWLKTQGTEREKGYFGIAASTNVELAVNKAEHTSLIDVKELPPSIWESAPSPILLAFKYLNHPFTIDIDVTKHQELPVLVAAIDSAEFTTLQTEEGNNLTKAVYQVRNNVKQFLRINLPKDSVLWSVFVAAKPVKPAKDNNQSILIPLEKSRLSGQDLTQFPVEIVYLSKISKMGITGRFALHLPKVDIPINSAAWSVYLPIDYTYFNFGGDLKIIRGGYKPFEKMMPLQKEMQGRLSAQFASEDGYGGEYSPGLVKGVLPIKVNIPQEGRVYRFSKLLITENESPKITGKFITVFRPLHGAVRFVIIAGLALYIIRLILKIKRKKNN